MRIEASPLTSGTMTTVFPAPGVGNMHFAVSGTLTGAEVINVMVDGRSYSSSATLNFNSTRHQMPLACGVVYQFSHTTLLNACQVVAYPQDRNY